MAKPLTALLKRYVVAMAQFEKAYTEVKATADELIPRVEQMAAAIEGTTRPVTITPKTGALNADEILAQIGRDQTTKRQRTGKLQPLIVGVLRDADRPLKTKEIYDQLKLRGTEVGGNNPLNNLSANMSHYKAHFVNTPEGWTLRQETINS